MAKRTSLVSPSIVLSILCLLPQFACSDHQEFEQNASEFTSDDETAVTTTMKGDVSGPSQSTSPKDEEGEGTGVDSEDEGLLNRAYIVSLHSDQLTVVDLSTLSIIGQVGTGGQANHMAATNSDGSKVYVTSSNTDEVVVIDARTLSVSSRIPIAGHPTHISGPSTQGWFAIMAESMNSVEMIDSNNDQHFASIPGFSTPHFLRFAPDGSFAYVANIDSHHISRIDLTRLEIDQHIVLDGFAGPPNPSVAPDEGGFADVQIDEEGLLYAAHSATNQVMVYDTWEHKKIREIPVGRRPWIAFADRGPEFTDRAIPPSRHIVANFGEASLSLIDGNTQSILGSLPGDENAYGVNYSSLVPNLAFVMNRTRHDIAVIDLQTSVIRKRIPVNGTIETAATSADGQWIVAAVSSANEIVVIDPIAQTVVKRFTDIATYPWSVTIPRGQVYCH